MFFLLIAFSLLGGARIFLFIFNRVILGNHRQERSPWKKWVLYATPPLLGALMLFFRPVHIVTAIVGVYWIAQRVHALRVGTERFAGGNPFRNDVYDLEVTRHQVEIANLPPSFDGYRIAFLTDTHVAPIMRRSYYRDVVAQTMRFQPDLILLGGDFITWERHIPLMAEVLLPDLNAPDGVYAVLGNHDYWSDADSVIAAMTARGVRFLINRSIDLHRGDDTIALAGIDEIYRGTPDVDAALARLDPQTPRIAVSHHPDVVDFLDNHRIDLLLCGHTHGGQIRFPFFGSIVVPSKHEARYASGFHRVANVLMYVSRGLGAIPPIRILCKPELATFILRPRSNAHETVGGLARD